MGFWGTFVLCRPAATLDLVAAISSRDESVEEILRPGGDWRVGQCDDAALFDDADAFLDEIVAETGAPALLGYVLDSDCVVLVAGGTRSGRWRSCLERWSLAAYGGVDDTILMPEPAIRRAREWAVEAGMPPDESALRTVFAHGAEEPDADEDEFVFAEELFFELVTALGTPQATTAPKPVTTRAAAPRRTRPKHPLDAFIYDYVKDLLADAGYTKRGRTFSRTNDLGDGALIGFDPKHLDNLVDFTASAAVVPRPKLEMSAGWLGRPAPDEPEFGFQAWSEAVRTTDRDADVVASSTWSAADELRRAEIGAELREVLSTRTLPMLAALLERPTLIDVVSDYHLTDGVLTLRDADGAAILLAAAGPSVLLDRALRDCDRADVFDYVHRRLAELGYPNDGWREGIEESPTDPVVRTRGLVTGALDAAMARHGFSRTDTRYFFESAAGDFALVQLTPQSYLGDEVRFRLASAVVPAGEVDRHATATDPAARNRAVTIRNGWLQEWVTPPADHAAFPDATIALTAGLWSFTDDSAVACAAAVADAVTSVLPRFAQLLDREQLAALVMAPDTRAHVGGYDHAADILGLDLADWHPNLVGHPTLRAGRLP